jgi:hypothetical protein
MPQPDLEERVTALEDILERALAAARRHPVGRQILRMLGLS